MRSCGVLSTTRNSSCAVVCGNRACCRLCLDAHVVSVCPACLQPRPAHSTIRSEAGQSPTPHSSVSQMTFLMRLHQNSISTTILSTSLWPHMLVPISSYPIFQYRTIRVCNAGFQLWAYLIRRADISRNIREVAYVQTAQLHSA